MESLRQPFMGRPGMPVRSEGKLSVWGSECVFQTTSPTFRCHQRSGSLKRVETVRTATTASPNASITGKENALRNADDSFADSFILGGDSTIIGFAGPWHQTATVKQFRFHRFFQAGEVRIRLISPACQFSPAGQSERP